MRLIDADALKDELTDKVFSNHTSEFWGTMRVIDEMPTIELPEQKSADEKAAQARKHLTALLMMGGGMK